MVEEAWFFFFSIAFLTLFRRFSPPTGLKGAVRGTSRSMLKDSAIRKCGDAKHHQHFVLSALDELWEDGLYLRALQEISNRFDVLIF